MRHSLAHYPHKLAVAEYIGIFCQDASEICFDMDGAWHRALAMVLAAGKSNAGKTSCKIRLGYGQGTGEQLKYMIFWAARPLAAIGFSAAAWRVACRDQFIGWDDQARRKNLALVVNNHRFLILQWVNITNLASWILAHVTRRLRQDWQAVYAHDLALVETFVENKRFHGTCYRAANWIGVGETIGRGRNDRTSTNWLPIKEVYLYPLDPHFRQRLGARLGQTRRVLRRAATKPMKTFANKRHLATTALSTMRGCRKRSSA
jgi:hypothetical protein